MRAAETVGRPIRGYDGGKKIDGRKRHIAIDTQGLLLVVLVTAASNQDPAGGWPSGRCPGSAKPAAMCANTNACPSTLPRSSTCP
ncbi:transposase [Actinocrispum sp. NPDC049592]|uniref:transposase n=1 Tax=Actinocrispum sp. NPDC049592 TaxID=3154835 RepID=UPI00343C6758